MNKKIDNHTSFVIYGCGEVGNNCYRTLTKNGYSVIYGLDKKKEGRDVIEGIYTYILGSEPEEIDKKEMVVIICLANGLIHKKVADTLYKGGYKYIVFLPMQHCITDTKRMQLTHQYNAFLQGNVSIEKTRIQDYHAYLLPNLDINNGIVREEENYITVWCGIEILFSESLELWEGDKTKIWIKSEYEDKNILAHPCKSLFDYFDMETSNADFYFSCNKESVSEDEVKRKLNEREKLFRIFKKEHNKGMDFFIEGAPGAIWNPKHYWNLVGGHHRTLYLLHEKHSLMPVKVKREDFLKWYNKKAYEKLCNFIFENSIQQLYAPIPHPGFVNFPSKYENNGITMLEKVMEFLADKDIQFMKSMDCLEDEGYFARNMSRIGVAESVYVSGNAFQLHLTALINELLYQDVKIEQNDLKDRDAQFDIVFGREEEKQRLIKLCRKYLFVDKENNVNSDNVPLHEKNYVCLLQEYRSGSIHEFGVYIVEK